MQASGEIVVHQQFTRTDELLQEDRGNTWLPLFSSADLAWIFDRTPQTIGHWARSGVLIGVRAGKNWRFKTRDILTVLIQRLQRTPIEKVDDAEDDRPRLRYRRRQELPPRRLRRLHASRGNWPRRPESERRGDR